MTDLHKNYHPAFLRWLRTEHPGIVDTGAMEADIDEVAERYERLDKERKVDIINGWLKYALAFNDGCGGDRSRMVPFDHWIGGASFPPELPGRDQPETSPDARSRDQMIADRLQTPGFVEFLERNKWEQPGGVIGAHTQYRMVPSALQDAAWKDFVNQNARDTAPQPELDKAMKERVIPEWSNLPVYTFYSDKYFTTVIVRTVRIPKQGFDEVHKHFYFDNNVISGDLNLVTDPAVEKELMEQFEALRKRKAARLVWNIRHEGGPEKNQENTSEHIKVESQDGAFIEFIRKEWIPFGMNVEQAKQWWNEGVTEKGRDMIHRAWKERKKNQESTGNAGRGIGDTIAEICEAGLRPRPTGPTNGVKEQMIGDLRFSVDRVEDGFTVEKVTERYLRWIHRSFEPFAEPFDADEVFAWYHKQTPEFKEKQRRLYEQIKVIMNVPLNHDVKRLQEYNNVLERLIQLNKAVIDLELPSSTKSDKNDNPDRR